MIANSVGWPFWFSQNMEVKVDVRSGGGGRRKETIALTLKVICVLSRSSCF